MAIFKFTLLKDGTYEIAAADVGNMPSEVVIPAEHNGAAITRIGDWAFAHCGSLVSVTIPSSVASIGDYAFYGCADLIEISFTGTKVQWEAVLRGDWWDYYAGDYFYIIRCTDALMKKYDPVLEYERRE